MAVKIYGESLISGHASGAWFRLAEPVSFWGGVDHVTGIITQPRHPDFQRSIAGTVLGVPGFVGSSSGSAVLLELIYNGNAPVALVMDQADAILALGVIVAREMGYGAIPVIRADTSKLPNNCIATVHGDGSIVVTEH